MNISKNKSILIVIILGVIMTVFSSVLATMSYRKMQADSYVHTCNLDTVSAVRKLNYALSFGKPLDKYYGLEELLEGIMVLSEDIQGVEVTDEAGVRIQTVGDIKEEIRQSSIREEYIIKNSGIYTFTDFDAGTIILRLDISVIDLLTKEYVRYMFRLDAIILLTLVIATVICFSIKSEESIGIMRLRITGIIILVAAQVALGFFSMLRVDNSYQESVDRIAAATARMVENDINDVLEKGVYYDEITGLDEYLSDLVEDIPELSALAIGRDISKGGRGQIEFDLVIKDEKAESPVTLSSYYHYNLQLIRWKRLNNTIDVLILVLITVFISLEAINFITNHIELKSTHVKGGLYLPGFRLFVFVEGIAFTLDGGFFSVLSQKMYGAMELPDSMSFLSGMPNTMYSVAVLIGLLSCSYLIRRIGMRRILTFGVIAGIAGYILCAISSTLPMLIGARFIYGFCDGILINSIRLFAASQKDTKLHTKILVEYMSAVNLGVSCGVVIGGLIADVSSYTTVFLTGAVLGAVCLFLILFAGFPRKQEGTGKLRLSDTVKELRIPRVLIYMIAVVVPVYIATLFVGYAFPLFGDESGFSNSMVAGCLMLNYIIIAYLTDPIADRVIRRFAPETAMFIYMALQAASIGLFVFFATPWAAILALVLTSLWDCFGMVVIDIGLKNVKGTSMERCTLLQMLFGKLGMVIGPVLITSRISRGSARACGIIVFLLAAGLTAYIISIIFYNTRHTVSRSNRFKLKFEPKSGRK